MVRCLSRGHGGAQVGVGCEHSMEPREVDARGGDQCGEPGDKVQWFQDDVCRAVSIRGFQPVADVSSGRVSDRRSTASAGREMGGRGDPAVQGGVVQGCTVNGPKDGNPAAFARPLSIRSSVRAGRVCKVNALRPVRGPTAMRYVTECPRENRPSPWSRPPPGSGSCSRCRAPAARRAPDTAPPAG